MFCFLLCESKLKIHSCWTWHIISTLINVQQWKFEWAYQTPTLWPLPRCIYNLPPLAQNGINNTTPQPTLTAVFELCFQLSNQQSGVSTPGGWFWSCAAVLFQHVSWAQWRGLAPVWKLWQLSNLCREIQTKSNWSILLHSAICCVIHMFHRQRLNLNFTFSHLITPKLQIYDQSFCSFEKCVPCL